MGHLYVEQGICEVSGKILPRMEFDTVSCKHCQAVIRVILKGCNKAAETEFNCQRCHGPICKACAKVMEEAGWVCDGGIAAKVEHALKTGRWSGRHRYQFSILPQ